MAERSKSFDLVSPLAPDKGGFKKLLRSRMIAGLIVVVPLWLAIQFVQFVFALMRDSSWWVIEAGLLSPPGRPLLDSWGVKAEVLNKEGLAALPTLVQWTIGIGAVLLTVAVIYGVGAITANVFGRQFLAMTEAMLDRIPVVKTIYWSVKQMLETFTGESGVSFQKVVSVPFPSRECRSIGFLTGTSRDAQTGEELYAVFIATTPNPTTGFVFVMKKSEVIELDWKVEEAVRVVMSAGVLMPGSLPSTPQPPLQR